MNRRSATVRLESVSGRLACCLAVALVLVAPACWTPEPPKQTATWSQTSQRSRVEARIQIRQILRDLELAEATGNLAALGELYGPEATWVLPTGAPGGAAVIHGREAILRRYEALFAEMEVILDLSDRSVEAKGGTGQAQGWAVVSLTPRAGGLPELHKHFFRMVLERQPESPWRIRYLEWTIWEDLDEDPPEELPEDLSEELEEDPGQVP